MPKSLNSKQLPQTSRERLVDAALACFSEKWYGTVSIAEICRRAGLSNGIFYRYFNSKEEVFRHILELVIDSIGLAVSDIAGNDTASRLKEFSRTVFEFSRNNQALVKVFREGQYRFFEYEKRLKAVYENALEKVFESRQPLSAYIFTLGGLRFAAIRAAFQQIPVELPALDRILRAGIFGETAYDQDKVFSTSIHPLPLDIMPDARERILREGKTLIGKNGYFDTNIHEITAAAGLSTGAFYTYFENKEAFFFELIHRVGREVRRFISMNIDPSLNRLEREMRGLWLFIVHLSLDRHCYGIVREAEFVLPAAVREYYGAFAKGYSRNLPPDLREDVSAIEFMLGVAHYLGIEVIFDHSPENAMSVIREIGEYYRHGFGLDA